MRVNAPNVLQTLPIILSALALGLGSCSGGALALGEPLPCAGLPFVLELRAPIECDGQFRQSCLRDDQCVITTCRIQRGEELWECDGTDCIETWMDVLEEQGCNDGI